MSDHMPAPRTKSDRLATEVAAWLLACCVGLVLWLWASTRSSVRDSRASEPGAATKAAPSGQEPAPSPTPEHSDVEVYRKRVATFRTGWDRVAEQTSDTLHGGKVRFDKNIAGMSKAEAGSEHRRVTKLAEDMVVSVWNRETAAFNEFAKVAASKVDSGAYSATDRDRIIGCIGDATDHLKALRQELLEEARSSFGR